MSTGPLSELEQDRLDVAARKGSLVTALDNPIVGGFKHHRHFFRITGSHHRDHRQRLMC